MNHGKKKNVEFTSQVKILDFVAHHTFEISREVNAQTYVILLYEY
jgi:hypothetical protein